MPGEPTERPLGPTFERRRPLPPVPVPERPAWQWVPLDAIEVADLFRLRPIRGVAPLAEAIARDGQREPLILRRRPGGRFDLVCGGRRLEALRMLRRHRALAVVYDDLSEADALYLALCDDLERDGLGTSERMQVRSRLAQAGLLDARLEALFDRAERLEAERGASLGEASPASEGQASEDVEEVELEVLAARTRDQLADACNDLAVLWESWRDLDEGRQDDLIECVRYLGAMLPLLTGEAEDP